MEKTPEPNFIDSMIEKILDQDWAITLKSKWEELDVGLRTQIKWGMTGAYFLAIIGFIGYSVWEISDRKALLTEKKGVLNFIQSSQDEMQKLRAQNMGLAADSGGTFSDFIDGVATQQGLQPQMQVTVASEKALPATDALKETLVDVSVKKINIRQLVKLAHELENGSKPLKLRKLLIINLDPEGWLEAELNFSGFQVAAIPAKAGNNKK
jgi:hypothetical protein